MIRYSHDQPAWMTGRKVTLNICLLSYHSFYLQYMLRKTIIYFVKFYFINKTNRHICSSSIDYISDIFKWRHKK